MTRFDVTISSVSAFGADGASVEAIALMRHHLFSIRRTARTENFALIPRFRLADGTCAASRRHVEAEYRAPAREKLMLAIGLTLGQRAGRSHIHDAFQCLLVKRAFTPAKKLSASDFGGARATRRSRRDEGASSRRESMPARRLPARARLYSAFERMMSATRRFAFHSAQHINTHITTRHADYDKPRER